MFGSDLQDTQFIEIIFICEYLFSDFDTFVIIHHTCFFIVNFYYIWVGVLKFGTQISLEQSYFHLCILIIFKFHDKYSVDFNIWKNKTTYLLKMNFEDLSSKNFFSSKVLHKVVQFISRILMLDFYFSKTYQ